VPLKASLSSGDLREGGEKYQGGVSLFGRFRRERQRKKSSAAALSAAAGANRCATATMAPKLLVNGKDPSADVRLLFACTRDRETSS